MVKKKTLSKQKKKFLWENLSKSYTKSNINSYIILKIYFLVNHYNTVEF